MATKSIDTGKSVKFRICKTGYSPEYQHFVGDKSVLFIGGKFESSNSKIIDHLKECSWCEVYR